MKVPTISDGLAVINTVEAFGESPAPGPAILPASKAAIVMLADGSRRDLGGLTSDELVFLQWEQERAFAAKIVAAPQGSTARAAITCRAYDTVTSILAAVRGTGANALVMGMHPRHERLVLDLLAGQRRRGLAASFFEIGFASGKLLKRVADAGFPLAGIEVSTTMRDQALRLLGDGHRDRLYLGDFLELEKSIAGECFSLVYWNDVFEHIAPDEIGDWLAQIHRMLAPGGQLVTVTPNWHVRPSDITCAMRPPRSEAAGLHLKEYTLGEVARLLRRAGFESVATPLCVTPKRIVLCGSGLAGPKCLLEPALEWLPFRLAKLACRGLGLSLTIAMKK